MSDLVKYREFQQQGAGVADLSDRVKLVLTGADRVRYLNGQVTSNVQKLGVGQTQPACVTTAKGKLCAEIMITAGADSLAVDADPLLAETLLARLERYIISDDAVLEECPSDIRLLHFIGPNPAGWVHSLAGAPVQAAHRFGRPGWDYWTTMETMDELWPKVTARYRSLDEALLETLRIEAGVPRWGRELDENTLPPEAGLDRTHIDYHKGCYIGQEVISRLKSVGHVNRQLTGFVSEDGVAPIVGATIVAEGEERGLGVITSAAWSFALEKPIALGYLRRGSPASGLSARPADASSPAARIAACPLPFVAP
jgi:folate-binding protein YgfZ